MSTVTAVRTNDWKKDDGTVTKVTNVTFDDGREVPGYDLPSEPEIGKPLPDGWEVATSAKGKPYIKVPKAGGQRGGGAPAAFRNTRDGFFAEQQSIHRSVALDKALAFHALHVEPPTLEKLLGTADKVYAWLSIPSQGLQASGAATTAPTSSTTADEGRGGRAQNRTHTEGGSASPATEQGKLGEGEPSPPGVCAHPDNSPLKPDGSALPHGFLRCLGCGVVHKGG